MNGGLRPEGDLGLRSWSDPAIVAVALMALASGFGQFGVIAALFVALAVANFVSGRVVFGFLFAALAVMNVVMTVYVRRRRAQFAQRFPGFADRDRR